MPTPRIDPYFLTPDAELLAYFASCYARIASNDRDSAMFLDAQAAIEADLLLFIETCLWIQTKSRRIQLLKLNPAQMVLWETIDKLRKAGLPLYVIILKARQMGLSTLVAVYLYVNTILYPETKTIVMAHREDSVTHIFGMYERFQDYLFHGRNDDLRALYGSLKPAEGFGGRQGSKMVFRQKADRSKGLGSEIQVLLPSDAAKNGEEGTVGSGITTQNQHLSEVPKWGNAIATLGSVLSSLSDDPGSSCFIEATANRAGDDYQDLWDAAHLPENPFTPVFIPYTRLLNEYQKGFDSDETRDQFLRSLGTSANDRFGDERTLRDSFGVTPEQLNWRRRTWSLKCGRSWQVFRRNYPLMPEEAFSSAGGNFIDPMKVTHHLDKAHPPKLSGYLVAANPFATPYVETEKVQPVVSIYVEAEPFAEYLIGVDVATDYAARDHSCAVVLRRLPLEVVAILRGSDDYRMGLMEFPKQIALLGRYYNVASVLVERNALGIQVLRDLELTQLYPALLRDTDIGEKELRADGEGGEYGINTGPSNRVRLLNYLKEFYEEEDIWVRDERLLREVLALTPNKQGRIAAPKKGQTREPGTSERGFYDDLAMANSLCILAHRRLPPPKPMGLRQQEWTTRERHRFREELRNESGKITWV